jgi:hypothetical protein
LLLITKEKSERKIWKCTSTPSSRSITALTDLHVYHAIVTAGPRTRSFSSFLNMQLDRTVIPPAELLALAPRLHVAKTSCSPSMFISLVTVKSNLD